MKTEIFTPDELADAVDQLAKIKAQIAELKISEDTYKAVLVAAGHSAIEGTEHRAAISWSTRTIVNWQDIALKFNPSRQLIAAHTTETEPAPRVLVTARKTK